MQNQRIHELMQTIKEELEGTDAMFALIMVTPEASPGGELGNRVQWGSNLPREDLLEMLKWIVKCGEASPGAFPTKTIDGKRIS